MKSKLAIGLVSAPLLVGAAIAFHPGVALAANRLANHHKPTLLKQAGTYTVDPMHTGVGFEIDHLGLSRVQGRFDKVEGSIKADPKDLKASSVTFTIQAESVDTNVAPRDTDLKSANFFDVSQYPTLTFVSTKIEKHGQGYLATGDLTLHGVTKSIQIPFKVYGPITDPWKATRIGIVSDPITIDREDFGMHFDVPMVGSKVSVKLSLEATLNK